MYPLSPKHPSDPDRTATPAPMEALGRLLDLAQRLFDVPAAFVCLLNAAQAPRFQAAHGVDLDHPVGHSPFCAAVCEAEGVLVVEDARAHPALAADVILQGVGARFGAGMGFHAEGCPPGVLAILHTQPKTLSPAHQDLLAHLAHLAADVLALHAAGEQAAKLARLKTTLLTNMSHEIRTPLTSIIGFADILAEEASGNNREFAHLIRQSGQRLMQTLNSVLDLAQLEGGALRLAPERLDVVALAQQVIDLFRVQAHQRNLDLRLAAPREPVYAWLNAGALSRILTNLVSNAIKFTPEGHVAVIIHADADALELRVEDTGVGISEDFLPRLFGEFRQEAGGLTPGYQGSGLGLSITRRLVDIMGGAITVESEKGRGSVFIVRLPWEALRRAEHAA